MKYLRPFILLLLLTTSCNIINKEESTPSFLKIDSYTLNTDELGASNHNITNARVSADGQLIGVFELPTIIPILSNGATDIIISPGIQNKGMKDDRIDYPLVENHIVTLDLIAGNITPLNPELQYFTNVSLSSLSENFSLESGGINYFSNSGTVEVIEDTTLDSSPDLDVNVGKLIPGEDDKIEITTIDAASVQADGQTFLEFNYKADHTFIIGLKTGASNKKHVLIGLNPSFDSNNNLIWKKIYIDLKPHMEYFSQPGDDFNTSYKIFFESAPNSSDPIILLDNIKLLSTYF